MVYLHLLVFTIILVNTEFSLNFMNKLKTRRAAKKRFTKTVTGKYIRRKAFKGHLLEKKSSKRKRNLSQKMVVSFGDSFALRSMMPYV
jgi:large subunit ribosomal protein L35